MNCLVLISCCWLLKKTLVIPTDLTNPESASECTSFEEQKGRGIFGETFTLALLSSAVFHLKIRVSDFFLICFAREIKGFYQSSLENEVNFRGIMNVSPNILTKNWNFKKLRQDFVDKRAMITTTLTFSYHRKTLVPFYLRKKIPENAFLTLTVNYPTCLLKKNYDILKILRTHFDAEHPTRWWEEETLKVESTYTGKVYCICRYMYM